MNLRDIFETRLDERVHDIVYHSTYLPHALEIVKTGQFKLSSALAREYSNFEHPKGHPYYLSTSRTKAGNYVVQGGTGFKPVYGSGRVMLKLDGSWFNRHYRSAPVDYYQRTPKGESEQEDRVFSKEPTMPAPNILEVHAFMEVKHPRDGERLRKLMIECKKKNIPIYVYNDGQHWLYQNKKHALSFEEIKPYIEGRVDIDPQRWRATNYFSPWLELWYKNKTEQLSDKAKKLKYEVSYSNWINDIVQNLRNDLNNAKSPQSGSYQYATRMVNLLSKLGMKPRDFVMKLKLKWQIIALADKNRISFEDAEKAVKKGTQAELKNARGNAELAQGYAINNLGYDINHYEKTDDLFESKSKSSVLGDFLKFAVKQLKLTQLPKIKFQKKHSASNPTTFGYFDPETDHIVIVLDGRHPMDIMRTLAHELVHYKQRLKNKLHNDSGETGSEHENEANAAAGILMRDFGKQHAEYFAVEEDQQVNEIQLIPDFPGDLEKSYRDDYYKELVTKHTKDWFDIDDITVYKTQKPGESKTFRLIGVKGDANSDQIVLAIVFAEVEIRNVPSLTPVSTWVSRLVGGQNLAARVYVAASKRYKRMIISDDMQTSAGAKIWTQGLPKLGFKPQAYEMGFGLVSSVDPYNSPDDDVRWVFDATRKITHKTFGPGRLTTSKKDDDEDEDFWNDN